MTATERAISNWIDLAVCVDTCFVEIDAGDSDWGAKLQGIQKSVSRIVVSIRSADQLLWMPSSISKASALLVETVEAVRASGRMAAVMPRADGFPSDIPSTLTFLRTHEVDLFVEPAMLFTASMAGSAAEHCARIREALLSSPRICGVVLSNIVVVDGKIVRSGVENGLLPAELILRLKDGLAEHVAIYRVSRI